MPITICEDPGHNSFPYADTGASGNGLYEQDITLDIARRLKELLIFNGFNIIMTRDGDKVSGNYNDVTGSLKARCTIANQAQVNIYISLHINAGGGTGVEIWVADIGGEASKLANCVLPYLAEAGQWANRGIKVARDYVLLYTDMPAILIEHGFIDTTQDAQKLGDPNFRQALAEADCRGICDYYGIEFRNPKEDLHMDRVVLLNSPEPKDMILVKEYFDYTSVCPIFFRINGQPPQEVFKASELVILGGSDVPNHPNRKYFSGSSWFGTVAKVGQSLGQ